MMWERSSIQASTLCYPARQEAILSQHNEANLTM